jgi:hypothetical protein
MYFKHLPFKSAARLGILSACLLAPAALATTVDMTMTGTVNNAVLGGVYVNPYVATVNGVVTTIICDDFKAATYIGESWKATAITFDNLASNLGNVRWGGLSNALDLYTQAAWLSLQLLSSVGTPDQGQISYAIWGLFTPSALNTAGTAGAAKWIARSSEARQAGFVAGSNFVLYTPVTGTAFLNGRAMPNPQEFIAVRVPESSAAPMLVLNGAIILALAYGLRRRLVDPAK